MFLPVAGDFDVVATIVLSMVVDIMSSRELHLAVSFHLHENTPLCLERSSMLRSHPPDGSERV